MLVKQFIPLLLSINLLLFLNTADAQDFAVPEDTFTVTANSDNSVSVASGKIVSQTSKPVTIVWERVMSDLPSDFSPSQICDKNQCYASAVDSQGFELAANDTSKLDVHFVNNQNTGYAYVRVKVYKDRDSAATASFLHYRAKASNTTSTARDLEANAGSSIRIYPNPVDDYLQVKNKGDRAIKKIGVYNILGSKVISHKSEPNAIIDRINMQSLKKGIYMIRVYGKNNKVLMTKSVSKAR